MKLKEPVRTFKASQIVWGIVVLSWILTEYVVMHFQIAKHLHRMGTIAFYYRPLMMTLPLSVGFSTYRRLQEVMSLSGSESKEHLSRGMSSITLISYLTVLAALLDLS
jgi:hypothetical protein